MADLDETIPYKNRENQERSDPDICKVDIIPALKQKIYRFNHYFRYNFDLINHPRSYRGHMD